mmetsp:Transcript_52632/g.163316  ORF Transcript_52632/g.163316 Transcript_52632/m.163316 type:complete len:100 (-) Transcript_52632:80-379(-)
MWEVEISQLECNDAKLLFIQEKVSLEEILRGSFAYILSSHEPVSFQYQSSIAALRHVDPQIRSSLPLIGVKKSEHSNSGKKNQKDRGVLTHFLCKYSLK